MRKNVKLITLVLGACLSLNITSCSKEEKVSDTEVEVSDPEGTQTIIIKQNDAFFFDLSCPSIYMDENSNIMSSYYYYGSYWRFIEIGKMKGLGNIKTKPHDSGTDSHQWLRSYELKAGYGYVAYFWHGDYNYNAHITKRTYVRFYVADLVKNNSKIEKVTISFQTPFL